MNIPSAQNPATATVKGSPNLTLRRKLMLRRRQLCPKLGKLSSSPSGGSNYAQFPQEHLDAIGAERVAGLAAEELGRLLARMAIAGGVSLLFALTQISFGIALLFLFLAGWEMKAICDLTDAPA